MKGIWILILLVLGVGAAFVVLMRPSDADLVRLEDEIAGRLAEAEAAQNDAHRTLTALGAIQPTKVTMALDRSLGELRAATAQRREALSALRVQRPSGDAPRAAFVDQRRQARDQAAELVERSRQLLQRVALVDRFARDAEPRLRLMVENKGILFQLREVLTRREGVEEALLLRIDQIAKEADSIRVTASQVAPAAAENLAEADVLARTAGTEVDRILAEQHALLERARDILARG